MQKKIVTHLGIVLLVCLALGFPLALRYYMMQQETTAQAEIKSTLYKIEQKLDGKQDSVFITANETITPENIQISTKYTEHLLELCVEGLSAKDVMEGGAGGDFSLIDSIWARDTKEGCLIQVIFTEPYAYNVTVEYGFINIEANPFKEVYEKLVVLDPGRVLTDDYCLGIAKEVKAVLQKEGIEVILCREDDTSYTPEQCAQLANDISADMFISLEMPNSKDASLKGIRSLYNSAFFTQGLNSAKLAEDLENALIDATGADELGIQAGDGNTVIDVSQMPVALVQLGYQSNKAELKKLEDEAYRKKLVKGLCQGIQRAYE